MVTREAGNGRVDGKTALITGAGRGIGRAIAQTLAREGAAIFATDILAEDVEKTAALIDDAGGEATALVHDVRDAQAWHNIVAHITGSAGRLDILVNNAGRCVLGGIEDSSLADWREIIAVNLDSVFLGLHYCLPLLKVSSAAAVVNLSSTGGIVGVPGLAAYSAAKGGIRALSKTAAIEFAHHGYRIRVNSLHPGPIDTEHALQLMAQMFQAPVEEARAQYAKLLPLGRLGTPDDVASAVLYLVSDEASWVTGAELVVDGGDVAR